MAAKETPATRAARHAGVNFTIHDYAHDPAADSYGLEAAEKLGLDPARVLKTLVAQAGDELVVCIVPSDRQLDLKAVGKRSVMASVERAERATGYVAGGISPLGQRRRLRTLVDESALDHDTVYVSAGRRGLEIELAPTDLLTLTRAETRVLARP